MMKTPNSIVLEFDWYIDPSIKNDFYHILLEMNLLDQFVTYEIKPTQISFVKRQHIIILEQL